MQYTEEEIKKSLEKLITWSSNNGLTEEMVIKNKFLNELINNINCWLIYK